MRRAIHRAGLTLAFFVLAAPAAAQETTRLPSVELPPALDRVLRDYETAWTAGDAQALARLFTDDGFVTRPTTWVRGRAAILDAYARAGGPLRLRALAFETNGPVGYIIGAYGYGPAAETEDRGKFILALRQAADGRWLIAADLDSANRPPPGGPPGS